MSKRETGGRGGGRGRGRRRLDRRRRELPHALTAASRGQRSLPHEALYCAVSNPGGVTKPNPCRTEPPDFGSSTPRRKERAARRPQGFSTTSLRTRSVLPVSKSPPAGLPFFCLCRRRRHHHHHRRRRRRRHRHHRCRRRRRRRRRHRSISFHHHRSGRSRSRSRCSRSCPPPPPVRCRTSRNGTTSPRRTGPSKAAASTWTAAPEAPAGRPPPKLRSMCVCALCDTDPKLQECVVDCVMKWTPSCSGFQRFRNRSLLTILPRRN